MRRLQAKFDRLMATDSGRPDPNRLVLFLWQRPCLPEGLLALAEVYIRFNRMERAVVSYFICWSCRLLTSMMPLTVGLDSEDALLSGELLP
jgi:hypothetical protein